MEDPICKGLERQGGCQLKRSNGEEALAPRAGDRHSKLVTLKEVAGVSGAYSRRKPVCGRGSLEPRARTGGGGVREAKHTVHSCSEVRAQVWLDLEGRLPGGAWQGWAPADCTAAVRVD